MNDKNNTSGNTAFARDRHATLGYLLQRIETHMSGLSVPLIVEADSAITVDMARHQAWQLVHNGIRHLRQGAPAGGPGDFAVALEKTSLRNSSLAAGLHVPAPVYERFMWPLDNKNGFKAALMDAQYLTEAAQADRQKSRDLIRAKILSSPPSVVAPGSGLVAPFRKADEDETPTSLQQRMADDPQLAAIMDALQRNKQIPSDMLDAVSGKAPVPDAQDAMRTRLLQDVEVLSAAYREVCNEFQAELSVVDYAAVQRHSFFKKPDISP
ncbi:MAG: hypothetical protein OXT65_10125 [Alphaproteobacteria bacterium]|nr:hypothetical protein [Alphaproteobacteria bacterium]